MIMKTALAEKEALSESPVRDRIDNLLELLKKDPYRKPPACEKLCGELEGLYSRRIDASHRLVYRVMEEEKTVLIVSF